MTTSRIPSRMLRDAATEHDDAELLADFILILLDALEIPEVRDAVLERLEQLPRTPPKPFPSPPGRGRTRRP